MMLVEMLQQAGCPDGVVNVIHGAHDAVNFICDHPDIRAISFVGSNNAVSFGVECLPPSVLGHIPYVCDIRGPCYSPMAHTVRM